MQNQIFELPEVRKSALFLKGFQTGKWLERKEDRYTSHDIQNEIISIMANHVIRDLVSEIRGGFFSIICDEYTDISNKEQLTICIRWVDKELQAHEDFLGFYNVPNIGAETLNLKPRAYLAFAPLDGQYAQALFSESKTIKQLFFRSRQFPLVRNSSPIYVVGSLDAKRK